MRKNIIVISILMGLAGWQCARVDSNEASVSLKQSLERNTQKVSTALNEISSSAAYKLITASDLTGKSEDAYNDSITLGLISGIYTYMPDTLHFCRYNYGCRLFKKTGESDSLIVKLPDKIIYHPYYLRNYQKYEEALSNNFTIAASDYHFYYSFMDRYDYKLIAGFKLDTSNVGSMSVLASGAAFDNQSYSSEYTFPEGYKINASYEWGDTSTTSFTLKNKTDLLLGESIETVKSVYDNDEQAEEYNRHRDREWKYTLSIGNVDIVKSSEIDSIQVFLDGVLQKNAAAVIVDTTASDSEHSICYHRDIQLTFDDGTTTTLSELIGPALTRLKELVSSLRSMTFAKRIVDYIAFNIYYSRQWNN